jgi:hypothetical protein
MSLLIHCRACGVTCDGNAQCCFDMDREEVKPPLTHQYAYNPQTNSELGSMLQGALWHHPGKTTLQEYAATLQWGVEASLIGNTIQARPPVAQQAILSLVMGYLETF